MRTMFWIRHVMFTQSGGGLQSTSVQVAVCLHALSPMFSAAIAAHGTFWLGRSAKS